jgi:hypothetical protein
MKKLRLILGIMILLLGAGAGWFFFMKPSQAAAATVPAPPPAPDPIYVDMAPLVLPVIDGGRVDQVIQVTLVMEVADEAAAEKIRIAKPRLEDAFLQDLYGAIDRHRLLDGQVVDVSRLRDELTRSSIGVLGQKSFNKILIQRIAQRML